jgi:uncharacterized membrane protein
MTPERVGVGAWIALVALQFAWYLVIAPPATGSPWLALALTLPALLLPLLALRTGVARALFWVGVVALFYFCHGVVAAWTSPGARVPAIVECVLCVVSILAIGAIGRRDKRRRA